MARHADVVDDDEFAWQSPEPKKKKKRKSKTSSVRSKSSSTKKDTGSSANLRASGKTKKRTSSAKTPPAKTSSSGKGARASSSGVRKSGKRRPSGRSSAEDMNASGRRSGRRTAPAKKKKGVDPIIIVSLITGTLLLCGGIIAISKSTGPTQDGRNEPAMMEQADKLRDEGMAAFREWSKAQRDGPPGVERAKHKEALSKLKRFMELMNDILEPHRDPSTGMTSTEYEGWEEKMAEVAPYMVDLEKGAKMDSN